MCLVWCCNSISTSSSTVLLCSTPALRSLLTRGRGGGGETDAPGHSLAQTPDYECNWYRYKGDFPSFALLFHEVLRLAQGWRSPARHVDQKFDGLQNSHFTGTTCTYRQYCLYWYEMIHTYNLTRLRG